MRTRELARSIFRKWRPGAGARALVGSVSRSIPILSRPAPLARSAARLCRFCEAPIARTLVAAFHPFRTLAECLLSTQSGH
jgi:hypothetical protein